MTAIQRTNYCPLCESNTRRAEAAEAEVARLRELLVEVTELLDAVPLDFWRVSVRAGLRDRITAALGEER